MDDKIKNIEVVADQVVPPTIVRTYTDEDVETFAAKAGGRRNLREISVLTDTNEDFRYLVKKPSRAVVQAIAEASQKKDASHVTEIQKLLLGCVLAGDKEAYEHDGAIYTQLAKEIGQLMRSAQSDIKKL